MGYTLLQNAHFLQHGRPCTLGLWYSLGLRLISCACPPSLPVSFTLLSHPSYLSSSFPRSLQFLYHVLSLPSLFISFSRPLSSPFLSLLPAFFLPSLLSSSLSLQPFFKLVFSSHYSSISIYLYLSNPFLFPHFCMSHFKPSVLTTFYLPRVFCIFPVFRHSLSHLHFSYFPFLIISPLSLSFSLSQLVGENGVVGLRPGSVLLLWARFVASSVTQNLFSDL